MTPPQALRVRRGRCQKTLKWEGYERLRGWFARGLAFERDMVKLLREDAAKPRTERRFLGDFHRPRIETQVGVRKPDSGLRYADVLVIEDASAALRHYGERLDIRRNSLQSLLPGGSEVQVPRVRLIYEGGELKPENAAFLNDAVTRAQSDVPGVEVSFQ